MGSHEGNEGQAGGPLTRKVPYEASERLLEVSNYCFKFLFLHLLQFTEVSGATWPGMSYCFHRVDGILFPNTPSVPKPSLSNEQVFVSPKKPGGLKINAF